MYLDRLPSLVMLKLPVLISLLSAVVVARVMMNAVPGHDVNRVRRQCRTSFAPRAQACKCSIKQLGSILSLTLDTHECNRLPF